MYRKICVAILTGITLLTTGGCAVVLQQLIDPPKVIYQGMQLEKKSLFEATPVFRFFISNSNPMSMMIRNIVYNLKLDDKKFIKGIWDKNINLRAVGSSTVELPITFSYPDIFGSMSDFMTSDKIAYDLSGFISIGPFAIPYHTHGTFDIPKLPDISLKQIEVSDFTFTGASVIFVAELKNINPFPLKLTELTYEISLKGREFASGVRRDISAFDSGEDTAILRLPAKLSFIEMGEPAYEILSDTSSVYELSGRMKLDLPGVGNSSFPFRKFGNIPILGEERGMK